MDRLNCVVIFVALLAFVIEAKPTSESLSMPAQCAGQTFCNIRPQDYPQDLIEILLQDMKVQVDTNDTRPVDRVDVSNGCETIYFMDLIYQIVDENDKIRWVVQSEDKFKQAIRGRPCKVPGRVTESDQFGSTLLDYMDIRCENLPIDYSFLVLSEDLERLETAKNKGGIPVGCLTKFYGYV